jgi:hypothetical protein
MAKTTHHALREATVVLVGCLIDEVDVSAKHPGTREGGV